MCVLHLFVIDGTMNAPLANNCMMSMLKRTSRVLRSLSLLACAGMF